ncbi:MAG TPA: hypothetical protein VGM90_22485 [Kofleriaceae bacterium]|jgi:hypothetical protein
MLKTLAAIVLSVGMTACMDDPQTQESPPDDNAGDTQPAATGSDHQDPDTLGNEPLIDPDVHPETDAPEGFVGCAPNRNQNNAGQTFKTTQTPGDDHQCRPIAG